MSHLQPREPNRAGGRRSGRPGLTPRPPTTVSSCPVNSPVSIGIAAATAALVSGRCSEASWCSLLSHTSVTQTRSGWLSATLTT